MKTYKMRGQTFSGGENSFVDLDLEFEGKRAFIIWEEMELGNFQLQARMEIDPRLLQRVEDRTCDYVYHGELVLPRPENN